MGIMRALLCLAIFTLVCSPAVLAAEIRLAAAASMADAVRELSADYRQAHPEVSFTTNFASSGTLARQLAQGAPADLFISANEKWMDYLVEQKVVPGEAVRALAGNTLVFVGAKGIRATSLPDLPALGRIAIGSPKSVPAGEYARKAMQRAGVWEKLAAGKLVMAEDVRQALLYAERGEVDGAFVYRTDALLVRNAQIAFEIPQDLYPAVIYPVALTGEGRENPAAVAFYQYLKGSAALGILQKYGFKVTGL